MKYLVEIKGVNKLYKVSNTVSFHALRDINLKIKKGEFTAIVGPSGSGKSTLMNIIGLLDKPSSGIYKLDGEDVSKFPEEKLAKLRNKKLGFVFQSFNLLQRTTSLQNVALPLIYAGIPKREREEKARELLEEVGLEDKICSFPNQLSGGEQQRIAIARALVTNTDIILADEPTGNLDSKSGEEIISILENLNKKGKTILLITHSQETAKKADRIINLKDGGVV